MTARHTTPAGGNVFEDLGFGPEEAENLKVRADLMIEIRRIIEERKLKQTEAAQLFGVHQPRISELLSGKIEEFSIDSLINMLSHAGVQVRAQFVYR